jgi:rSAM/selenodomain-associated transferase 2
MTLSIIIPTYNEAENIGKLVSFLHRHSNGRTEIIVSDGGSTDNTMEKATEAGAKAFVSAGKGRAAQMNYGTSVAGGDVFYFVHADCYPPAGFISDIEQALRQGYHLGRYRTCFDSPKTLLKINAWITRFDLFICMGGDQTLFIKRSLFEDCRGFKEDMLIMEEYEFCQSARQQGRYKIMNGAALVSARKYEDNSWWQVLRANAKVVRMYKKGASQQHMVQTYKQMLAYRKNSFD